MFASDGITPPGADPTGTGSNVPVPPTGPGGNVQRASHHRLEDHADVSQIAKGNSFQSQFAILAFPRQPVSDNAPASVPNAGRPAPSGGGLWSMISRVRRAIPPAIESKRNLNAGYVFDWRDDPEQRGTQLEPFAPTITDLHVGPNFDQVAALDGFPQPITNRASDPKDDILRQVQDMHGEEFYALRSFRANFPFVPVLPVLQSRTVVVSNTAEEVEFPDGTVLMRFWQVNSTSQTTPTWCSFDGAAFVPSVSNTNNSLNSANDGVFAVLPATGPMPFYYVKGKKSISLISNGLQNYVCFQFYLNN